MCAGNIASLAQGVTQGAGVTLPHCYPNTGVHQDTQTSALWVNLPLKINYEVRAFKKAVQSNQSEQLAKVL